MANSSNSGIYRALRMRIGGFLRDRFALDDNAPQQEVEANICKSSEFKGQNLWILIFAIVIASIGLNVNSTAVIIGAMLISPIMGPIMGFGLSLGVYDFELLKSSLRNLLFAVAVALISSTIYFILTPLSVAQSELLARTSPTIWDVLIAFFGGATGMLAQTRKDRTSTVIPGVAIATALMPPICTAGYGLATLQLQFTLGALYLFTINAVLISVATLLVVRYLKYKQKRQLDKAMEHRIRNYIFAVILVTIIPSMILAYNLVRKTIFETNANAFIAATFNFEESQVVDTKFTMDRKGKVIEVLVIGKSISDDAIATLNSSKSSFKLDDVTLIINQQLTQNDNGLATTQTLDKLYSVSSKLLDEKQAEILKLKDELSEFKRDTLDRQSIAREFSALSQGKSSIAISRMSVNDFRGEVVDSVVVCVVMQFDIDAEGSGEFPQEERERITAWLKERTNSKRVEIILLEEINHEQELVQTQEVEVEVVVLAETVVEVLDNE